MHKIYKVHKPLIRKVFSCILAINIIFPSVSCKNYFSITTVPNDNISELKISNDIKEPVFVHWYNTIYDLKEVTFDSTSVSGIISLSENKLDYKFHSYSSNDIYKRSERNNINTMHIYLLYSYLQPKSGTVTIDSKYIDRIEIIGKNSAKTTKSHLLGWAGITVLVALIVATAINPPVGIISFPTIGL